MRESDKQRFAEIMTMAHLALGMEISKKQLQAWFALLKDFDVEQIGQAMQRHLLDPETGKFPPKPADIVRHCQGTHHERALAAWNKLCWALVHVGPYHSIAFDDPLIHALIANMGGWEKFCGITNDELPFRQRDFERAYVALSHNPPQQWAKHLIGIAERENRTEGYGLEHPVGIGNPELVRRVMLAGSDTKPGPKVTRLASVKVPSLDGPKDAA